MDDATARFLGSLGDVTPVRRERHTGAGRPATYGRVTGPATELAIRIKLARHRRGWTQRELAARADSSRLFVETVERGREVLPPGLGALRRIREVLGLDTVQ